MKIDANEKAVREQADIASQTRSMKRMQAMMAPRQSRHVLSRWRCYHPAPQSAEPYAVGDYNDVLVVATKRHPRTVRAERRKRNKVARASRKRNRA